jgi:AcrR family transcriptional regulator
MTSRPASARKRPYRMVARAEAAEETRERTTDMAWRHFSERPYDEVRLADIAADAGVSVQTLHTIHGTKEQVFVAAWIWFARRQVSRREEAPVGDVATAVRLLWDTYEQAGDAGLRVIAQEDRIPEIRAMADHGRAYHRNWVDRTFAPYLTGLTPRRRERRLAALILATDLLAWKLLRREMQLDRAVAERVVVEVIEAMGGEP